MSPGTNIRDSESQSIGLLISVNDIIIRETQLTDSKATFSCKLKDRFGIHYHKHGSETVDYKQNKTDPNPKKPKRPKVI